MKKKIIVSSETNPLRKVCMQQHISKSQGIFAYRIRKTLLDAVEGKNYNGSRRKKNIKMRKL